MPISLDQYRVSSGQFYSLAIRTRHILSLFEYQLINMLIFRAVKFLPCLIILHFLCNDLLNLNHLEQEVTKFMMHNHHGTKVIAILLIISGIELNPGPLKKVLYGTFYVHPSSPAAVWISLEYSIELSELQCRCCCRSR
jgi:hypothetical protein